MDGMARFVRRLWRTVLEVCEAPPSSAAVTGPLAQKAHQTIARVSDDIGRRFHFNTPIAAVMELVNGLPRAGAQGSAGRFAAGNADTPNHPHAPHAADGPRGRRLPRGPRAEPRPESSDHMPPRPTAASGC